MTRGASQRLDQQRQQTARRRQERAEARHQNDLGRIEQSGQQRAIRQQRSDLIDTMPGLSPQARYDLHHSGQARANVGQIKGLDPTHARRLGEYEQALASGSRSVQSFRADRFANRAAEAAVRGQEIQTDYLPTDLRGYMAERAARTANTQSLAASRDADTQRQNAAAPLELQRMGIENEQLSAVTPRVQDGSVLPPRYTNDVRVPRGLNRLDEAKAFDAETRGQLMLQQMEAASRPPRPDYSERVRALQTIVNDEDAGKDEKANARQELAEIAALDQLEDYAASGEINIGEAVAVFEDGQGRRVYQMPDGRYRYDDGREYQDPTQIVDGLGQQPPALLGRRVGHARRRLRPVSRDAGGGVFKLQRPVYSELMSWLHSNVLAGVDPKQLEDLPKEIIASYLLRWAHGVETGSESGNWQHLRFDSCTHDLTGRFHSVVLEALNLLTIQNLIAPKGDRRFFFVTQDGHAQLEGDVQTLGTRILNTTQLPKAMLHPDLRDSAWPIYCLGLYQSACLEAFWRLEDRVRKAAGYDASQYGRGMMAAAFGKHGPLTDSEANKGEQDSLRELFSGAFGYYRNPLGHREVKIESAAEAAEMLMFASNLFRVLDRRLGEEQLR